MDKINEICGPWSGGGIVSFWLGVVAFLLYQIGCWLANICFQFQETCPWYWWLRSRNILQFSMLPWIKKFLRHQYQYTIKSHAIFQYGILCISWVLFFLHIKERRMRTLLHGSCILDTMMQNHFMTTKC